MVKPQLYASASAVSAAPLTTCCLGSLDEFNAIQNEWNRLVEQSNGDPVFSSHAWLRTWWECFGADHKLHILLVWAGKDLIGAAPMMIATRRMYGIAVRRLESIYNFHTPRFDFPIAARHEEVYAAIWKELSRTDATWDVVMLAQVPEDSPTLSSISRHAAATGWSFGRWKAAPSPVIKLGCDYDAVLTRLKGKERYNLRKRFGKLSEIGAVDLEVVSDGNQVREVMQDGLRIEAAAWKGEHGTAIKSDPQVEEFYMRLAERAAGMGWLRLCFLRVNGKRVAFDYMLEKERVLYAVKIGYDPEYHTYSPGHLLMLEILQKACAEGCKAYDFLGADDDWKFMWTKDVRHHHWLFLFPDRVIPRLLRFAKFELAPRVKAFGLKRAQPAVCISRHGPA